MVSGNKIKELRKNNNLTQKDLAKLLGLSTSTVQKYELEQREPTIETLSKMSEIFNVPIDAFTKKYLNMHSLSAEENRIIHDYICSFSPENKKRNTLKTVFNVNVDNLTDSQIDMLFNAINFTIQLKLEEFKKNIGDENG